MMEHVKDAENVVWQDLKEINFNNSGDCPDMVCYVQKAAEEIRRFK